MESQLRTCTADQMTGVNEMEMELLLIRHGRTAGNEAHRYIGSTEEPLSAAGIRALLTAKEQGKYPPADLLLVSPMERCIQTAELLYGGAAEQRIIPELREMDFGLFEGKNYKELSEDAALSPLYQQWIDSGGEQAFPEGESRDGFIRRVTQGFLQAVQELPPDKYSGEIIACVVHGGTIMAILSAFGPGEYYDYQLGNGEGYSCLLTLTEGGCRISDIRRI